MSAREEKTDPHFYDLVIDSVPKIADEDREAALRLVNRQAEAALLRQMLGLEPPSLEVVPKPEIFRRPPEPDPTWCSVHKIARKPRLDRPNQYRCLECGREYSRRVREKRNKS